LTVFEPIEEFNSAAVPARLDVQNLIHEIGLIDEADLKDEASPEIEPEMAEANAEANDVVADKEDLSEETNKRAVTLVPGSADRFVVGSSWTRAFGKCALEGLYAHQLCPCQKRRQELA
jgi:hypothetical protein